MSGPAVRRRRQEGVVEAIREDGLDAFLVSKPANVRYLSGFSGSHGWLLLTRGRALLLTDGRYRQQAGVETRGSAEVVIRTGELAESMADLAAEGGWKGVGFEPAALTVDEHDRLTARGGVVWNPVRDAVEALRQRKDPEEVEAIRRALRITEEALRTVVAGLSPGCTERELAADLEHACRRLGAAGMAFATIVASGPRTAWPHGVAGGRRIEAGEPVMVDIGCRVDGYCSDLTRMIWVGSDPDPEWLALHRLVDRARAMAIATVGAGADAADVDRAARDVIEDAGYGEGFSHGTGHGVGLEIHEAPRLAASSEQALEEGMVVTVEPAVYLQEGFGVRIEDLVRVSAQGCTRLTALEPDPILA